MKQINTFETYHNKEKFIKESRYKTHGLDTVKRHIPMLLKSLQVTFEIEYFDTDDVFIIIASKLKTSTIDSIVSRCGILGYFPSILTLNSVQIKYEDCVDIDMFIDKVKKQDIENTDKVVIQFESWLDDEIKTPETLYHVCKKIHLDKIKRYGLYPKAKHKISHHPDRIYLVDDIMHANDIRKQLKEIDNDEYVIVLIKPNQNNLILRTDPNYNMGFYTNQNIPPNWIKEVI